MNCLLRLFALHCLCIFFVSSAFADECIECHKNETPAAVEQWQSSAHAPDISCSACHGSDHDAILKGDAPADAKVCGRCHEKAYQEHVSSKHGLGFTLAGGVRVTLLNETHVNAVSAMKRVAPCRKRQCSARAF